MKNEDTINCQPNQSIYNKSNTDENINPKKLLAFGSKQIISLFIPVSICMIIVGIVAKTVDYYSTTDQYLIYTPFHSKDAGVVTTLWQSFANAMIMISLVAVMSIGLVLLYKYRCYKFIHGYLIFSTVIILFMLFTTFFVVVVIAMKIFMDYVTLVLFIWNFGVMGFIVIHWKGPLLLQQLYLIIISAKVALVLLKFMPLWTTWVVLGVLAIWDLVAVLCPFGPLRILVELATERNEPIFPALIYSTTMMVKDNTDFTPTNHNRSQHQDGDCSTIPLSTLPENVENNLLMESVKPNKDQNRAIKNRKLRQTEFELPENEVLNLPAQQSVENCPQVRVIDDRARLRENIRNIHEDVIARGDRGVKLGLGDFVFYSLLMGRATLDSDPNTIVACYISILVGMFMTILLLTVAGRALPALPISMACGILFYFVTSLIISPFTRLLLLHRVFI